MSGVLIIIHTKSKLIFCKEKYKILYFKEC